METDITLHKSEEPLPTAEMMAIIRDFFRTEMRPGLYSPGQLSIILKEDPDQRKLLRIMQSSYEFPVMPTFNELYQQFQTVMQKIRCDLDLKYENLIEDFKVESSSYRNYKSGETKQETFKKIDRFAALFGKNSWRYFPRF